ncbi:MAG TPA: nuclear transport factor 2 family protein [Gemmatimonadaceae bacterium]
MRRAGARGLILLVIAGAAGIWAWRTFFPSDEQQIRRRLDEIIALVNEPAEGLDAVARAAQIGRAFTDDVVVELRRGAEIRGKDALMGMAARVQPRTTGANFRVRDVTVTVEGEAAQTDLTATWSDPQDPDQPLDAAELRLQWVERDGDWLIARVERVDVLKR